MIAFLAVILALVAVGTVFARRRLRYERRRPIIRLTAEIRAMTAVIAATGVAATQIAESMRKVAVLGMTSSNAFDGMRQAMRQLQANAERAGGRITFASHPDLVHLDAELDNCYPNIEWPG